MSFKLGSRSRNAIVALGALTGLVVVAAAVAYFTGGSGSGTGSATVGTSTAWSVSVNSAGATFTPSGYAAIYPGAGTEVIPFIVTNNGKGSQNLATLSYAIKNDGGSPATAETASGTVITGCLASWFSASGDAGNAALPDDLAASGTYSGKVDVTMTESGTDQDACQGQVPGVVVTGS